MTVPVKRSYIDGRHGQMHVRIAEPKQALHPPMLFIHMSPMTGRVFEKIMARMAEDRLCIAFDTPGFGMSDAPSSPPDIEDYAQDLLTGLEALGIEGPVDLLGYHTGSMISVAAAVAAPDRIRRVTMVSAPIFPAEEKTQFDGYYAHRKPQPDGSHLVKRWKGFLYHHLRPGVTIDEVSDIFPDALLGREIEWWGHRAAFAFDLAGMLAKVRQPVFILVPGDDLDVQTRRATGLAPNGHMLEVPGWGHGFLDHHTDEAADLIRTFLDAGDDSVFTGVRVPPSADKPRYPERVGSFPPAAVQSDAA